MKIIGLTGSVASGKNFVAEQFKKYHIPVFDADKAVHEIFNHNKNILKLIKKHFPKAVIKDRIDRPKLGKEVLGNLEKLTILEQIIHPEVRELQNQFIRKSRLRGAKLLVLNIPLLFEKGGFRNCDQIICVVTPKIISQYRFLKRAKLNNANLTADLIFEKFHNINQKQINNYYKKKLSDFIIYNGLDKGFAIKQTKRILNYLL